MPVLGAFSSPLQIATPRVHLRRAILGIVGSAAAAASADSSSLIASNTFKVSTFNLLCPAYRRMVGEPDSVREESYPQTWRRRQGQILDLDLWDSDIICCQEFWYGNKECFDLYVDTLRSSYNMYGLQRPGPTGLRPDGLFMAIRKEWEVISESDIDFADAAGRCAQLLHLRRVGSSEAQDGQPSGGGARQDAGSTSTSTSSTLGSSSFSSRPTELIVANVHLLFPHNEASVRIRVREVHKMLSFLEQYKKSLSGPPPASLICGDFNGEVSSRVVQFLMRYGWQCTFSAARGSADSKTSEPEDPAAPPRWVSHFTHENRAVGVDYIWLSNPSQPRLPVPDWTDFVFSEMAEQLARCGFNRPADAWLYFRSLGEASASPKGESIEAADALTGSQKLDDATQPLGAEAFRIALASLDNERGDALSTLTEAEVATLVSSCDRDGDGCVDRGEWCSRFAEALRRLSGEGLITDTDDDAGDLHVEDSTLYPVCLEDGAWPDVEDWALSDHGVLTSRFILRSHHRDGKGDSV